MLHLISQTRRTRAGSNRLTVNVIRNQQPLGPEQLEAEGRNLRTLNETDISSLQAMDYYFPQLVGLRQSFASISFIICPSKQESVSLKRQTCLPGRRP